MTCESCGWPMRPNNTPVALWPGTRCANNRTQCTTCYKAQRNEERGGPRERPLTEITKRPCTRCGIDVAARAGRSGLCTDCVSVTRELGELDRWRGAA